MDDERPVASSGFVVTPETIAGRTFSTGFRGFDQAEVRTFLKRVSEELAVAAEREAQLRRLLHEAQNRAAHPEVDEDVLTNALGEHAARLLASAREQAGSIRSEAEGKASRLMRDVEGQISRIRSEADSLLARRVEEVDGVTANLRNAAEADARALREQAKADAEGELQAARNQGREMVAEARGVRERILADLARRRHVSEVQLDQLRAARERLLSAYALVRRTLDEATEELKKAEMEARMAADEVGRRAPAPPPAPAPHTPSPQLAPVPAADGEPGERRHDSRQASPPAPLPPAPRPAPVPAAAAAAARTTRTEPAPRSEPRLRPPGRPGEARPSPPSRRPADVEPSSPRTTPAPEPWSPPRRPERETNVPVATGRAPAFTPAPMPSAIRPPAPDPPSILPRPVAPPPSRDVTRHAPPPTAPTGLVPPVAWPKPPEAAPRGEEQPLSAEADRVDELFARIKADRAGAVAASMPAPAAPAPPSAVSDELSHTPPAGADEAPEFVDERPHHPSPAQTPGRDVADESARTRRDELLEPIEETLTRQLKRLLQDEQNEVLDRLRRKRRRRSGPALLDAEDQVARFREVAESILGDAVRAGVRFANPAASEAHAEEGAARDVADALAREIAEPLRQRLDRCFADADEADGDADGEGGRDRDGAELSDRLSALYRQWRAQEIERLARHHAVCAFGLGAYAAHPEEATLRWVVDDEAPCPDCDDNELAGTVTKGQPYPTGQLHPPAHPGCRCILVSTVP